MSMAALIRKMADAGAPPEAIALAVEAVEALQAIEDARKAKDRERKRRGKSAENTGTSAENTGTSAENPGTFHGNSTPASPEVSPQEIYNQPPILAPSEAILTDSSSAEVADATGDPIKTKKTRVSAEEKRQLQTFGESWNRLASRHGLPSVELIKPGSGRERNALARLRDITDDYHANVEALWDKISDSSFLRGEKSFVCTFDFVVNSANFTKIMEGNYADKKGKQPGYEPGRSYRQG